MGSSLIVVRAASRANTCLFQSAFLKLKRRLKGILVGVMIDLIATPIGRCCEFGIGLQTSSLQFGDTVSDTKHRSGL